MPASPAYARSGTTASGRTRVTNTSIRRTLASRPRARRSGTARSAVARAEGAAWLDDWLRWREVRLDISGADLAEGKPTLPLIYAMQHGSADQRTMIRHAIEAGGFGNLAEITGAVASLGGLAYTARLAQCEAEQALAALAPLPETAFKEGLSELAKFAVARKN